MVHSEAEHAAASAKGKEVGLERKRKRRQHTFLRSEIEALRELPRKLGWMDRIWLLFELLLAIGIVISCHG